MDREVRARDVRDAMRAVDTVQVTGRVHTAVGLGIRAHIPGARRGDWVVIERRHQPPLDAEIVGFEGDDAMLMPLGDARGLAPDDPVKPVGRALTVTCSNALLGRIVDGLGRPLDGGEPIQGAQWPVHRAAPSPLEREPIARPLVTGVRALDALCTVGEGQRLGIFSGSGVGKSTLLTQLARQAEAEVLVFCLVGERGRELRELWESGLDAATRARAVVVCATSDSPALVRLKSGHVATAIAEYFRAQGQRVVLLVDSLTRLARAARDVGLTAGEPAVRRGFPPSAFAELPALLERAGTDGRGSITGFYSVLVEGHDMDEPVADEVRGILDGHVVLTREVAARGRLPPIDVGASLSRLMNSLVDNSHREAASALRAHLTRLDQKRDLVELGAYERGSDPRLDDALSRSDAIEAFLSQSSEQPESFEQTLLGLYRLVK